jgi:hypothetical protein
MHSNDVSNPLNNWAVLKFVGKYHHCASLERPILLDGRPNVYQFECAGVALRVLSLVRIRGVNDHCEDVVSGIWGILAFAQLMVFVASFVDFFFL